MAVRKILTLPDPLLSQPSQKIDPKDKTLKTLIKDLFDTLYHSPGVGLAAPQIGVLKQVSVVDISRFPPREGKSYPTNHGRLVLINPTLLQSSGIEILREGCLSVPDLLANVHRSKEVIVKILTLEGKNQQILARGFEAIALQHEIDHLYGRLFLDRVRDLKTGIFRRKYY